MVSPNLRRSVCQMEQDVDAPVTKTHISRGLPTCRQWVLQLTGALVPLLTLQCPLLSLLPPPPHPQ